MSDSELSLKPLKDKFVVLACSAQKSSALAAGMEALGARVLPLNVIDIMEVQDKAPLDAALGSIAGYDWIVFTSSYAVQFFVQRLQEQNMNLSGLPRLKICAVGPGTAAALAGYGIHTTLMPDEYVAEGILRSLSDYHAGPDGLAGLRILLPRAKEAREVLPLGLKRAGVHVDVVPCYENRPGKIDADILKAMSSKQPDLIVFTSSSAITHFLALAGPENAIQILRKTPAAVLGPITAGTLESLGIKAAIVPEQNSIPSLLAAIGMWAKKNLQPQS
jgi:uroporphyrinogen III methyltransferase / synthase